MFTGEYQHTIDEKGRVSIPSKVREELGGSFFVTKGPDHCLFIYTAADWQNLCLKGKKLSFTNSSSRAFSRLFFSGAAELEFDKLGRVLVPGTLRQYASLNKDVIIIGVGTRLEMWDKDAWNSYSEAAANDYEKIVGEIADFDVEIGE